MIVIETDLDFDILIDPMFEIRAARAKLMDKYEGIKDELAKNIPNLTPDERRKALLKKYPNFPLKFDEILKMPITLEAIAKPTKRKVVLNYFREGDPRDARHVRGKIENHILYLDFYGYWKDKFEFWENFEGTHINDRYNQNPIGDRYDGQNKVIIYSTFYLPDYLANYFEVEKFYSRISDSSYGLKDI